MERKILFKAKRLDGKGWAIGDLLHSYENGAIIVPIEGGGAFSVDPSTVCQFTGLKDKDGVGIWEYDILKYITEREVIFGRFGIFLKGSQHIISLFDADAKIEDDKLIRWSNLGSKFDRKEGEK